MPQQQVAYRMCHALSLMALPLDRAVLSRPTIPRQKFYKQGSSQQNCLPIQHCYFVVTKTLAPRGNHLFLYTYAKIFIVQKDFFLLLFENSDVEILLLMLTKHLVFVRVFLPLHLFQGFKTHIFGEL